MLIDDAASNSDSTRLTACTLVEVVRRSRLDADIARVCCTDR